MFADPQSITVGAEPVSLPRIGVGNMTGTYRSGDGEYTLYVAHSANKRERTVVRLTITRQGVDPVDASKARNYMFQPYFVFDAPLNGVGFTDAEQEEAIRALIGFLEQPNAIAKLLGKES